MNKKTKKHNVLNTNSSKLELPFLAEGKSMWLRFQGFWWPPHAASGYQSMQNAPKDRRILLCFAEKDLMPIISQWSYDLSDWMLSEDGFRIYANPIAWADINEPHHV